MKNTHLTDTKFEQFDLADSLQSALSSVGYTQCTPIQAESLPFLLQGKDIAGQAQTGTGKTLAFLVATFNHLLTHPAAENKKSNQGKIFQKKCQNIKNLINNKVKKPNQGKIQKTKMKKCGGKMQSRNNQKI